MSQGHDLDPRALTRELLRLILEQMPIATSRDLATDGDEEGDVWAKIEVTAEQLHRALSDPSREEPEPDCDDKGEYEGEPIFDRPITDDKRWRDSWRGGGIMRRRRGR